MQKTQLLPRSQQEMDRWIKLLLEAKAEYQVMKIAKKEFLIVSVDDAINILEVEPPKRAKWVKPVLITLGVLIGLPIIGGILSVLFASDTEPPAEPIEMWVDYTKVIDQSKDELIATFGSPVSSGELKENCPEGDCGYLDFENGLSVTLRGGKANRFEFADKIPPSLGRIGIQSDADPDEQNTIVSRWNDVDGLEIVVTKVGDTYGYWVKKKE